METSELARRVASDTEDVLATIPLVSDNPRLIDHLFDQLVDLLIEGLLVDLRTQLSEKRLSPENYALALTELASQCRSVGLLSSRS